MAPLRPRVDPIEVFVPVQNLQRITLLRGTVVSMDDTKTVRIDEPTDLVILKGRGFTGVIDADILPGEYGLVKLDL